MGQTFSSEGCVYKITDEAEKTCKLIQNTSNNSNIIIPEEVNGYFVTEIANDVFRHKTKLRSIQLPSTLEKIGTGAFYECSSLTSVELPKSLNYIGIIAFGECSSLTSFTISPDNTSFKVENGIVLDSKKKSIICVAPGLSQFNIPNTVETIGNCSFYSCKKLESLILPPTIKFIENSAFNGCTSLYNINIPDNVIEIGNSAFYNCVSLSSINLPASTSKIRAGAFGRCISLTEINVDSDNAIFHNESNLVLNHNKTAIVICPAGLTKVEIPESVTNIASSSFEGCVNLENINIPARVTEIGSYAFTGCTSLKVIVLHEGLKKIEAKTFSGCSSLEEIHIPSTVTEIGSSAFLNCSSLKSIDIPSGGNAIQAFAFDNCSSLQHIMLGKDVKSIGLKSFQGCGNIETIVCYSYTAPKLSASAFEETVYSKAQLRVRENAIEEYSKADNWNKFRINAIQDSLVREIILDRTEYSAMPGDSFRLKATVLSPEALNKTLIWRSSDPDVATVHETGDVDVRGIGVCDITAEASDLSGAEAVCHVNALTTDITEINNRQTENQTVDVCSLDGRLIYRQIEVSKLERVLEGIYILKFKDHSEKIALRPTSKITTRSTLNK